MSKPGNQRGFTIAELVITVSLAALLLTLGVPALGQFIANQRMVTTTYQLITDLNQARLTAIKLYRRVAACPSRDGDTCVDDNRWEHGWIVFFDPDENWQPDATGDILRVTQPEEKLAIDTAGRTRIRFKPTGSAAGTNLTFAVCDERGDDHARAVIVSNTGRVRSQSLPGHRTCPNGI